MRRGARSAAGCVCLASGDGGGEVAKARRTWPIEPGRAHRKAGAGEAPGRLGAGLALVAMIVAWLAILSFATLVFLGLHLLSAPGGNERLRSPRRGG
jgi:hypothetical protein